MIINKYLKIMKKNLLLFVVLGFFGLLNAQNASQYKNANKSVRQNVSLEQVNVQFNLPQNENFNQLKPVNQTKATTITNTDTSKIVDYKQYYGSGNYYVGTDQYNNNIGYKLKITNDGTNSLEPEIMRTYPLTSEVTLTQVGVVLSSLNETAADVNVVVFDNEYNVLGGQTVSVTYTGSYSINYFVFDTPIALTDTFSVSIAPAAEKDSVMLLTAGQFIPGMGTASIDGTTLTVTDWTQYQGGFIPGKEISGTGVTAGTVVTEQTGYMTYEVSESQTVASTEITGEKYTFDALDNITFYEWTVPNNGDQPSVAAYYLFGNATYGPIETELYVYPVFDYTIENNPSLESVCNGTSNEVTVSLDYEAFQKNPLLSKTAFYLNFLGYGQEQGLYYARVDYTQNVADSVLVDNSVNPYGATKTYTPATPDTVVVTDILWTWNASDLNFFVDQTVFPVGVAVNLGEDHATCGNTILDAGAFASYNWNNGEGADQTFEVTETGTYSVEVADDNGCVNTSSVTVTVNELPMVDLGEDQTVCEGTTVTLDAGAFAAYDWNEGEGSEQTFEVTETGTYSVEVTDDNACSNSDTVYINMNPAATATAGGTANIEWGDAHTVSGATAENGSILWTVQTGNGTLTDETTLSPTYTSVEADENTTVTLLMTVTPEAPCEEVTATYTITVTQQTNVKEVSNSMLTVYPNPAKDAVTISNLENNSLVTIFDELGKQVYSSTVSGDLNINTENLHQGIYFININNNYIDKLIIIK